MSVVVEGPVVAAPRSWKAPATFAVMTVLFAVIGLFARREGLTTFRLSETTDAVVLPDVHLPVAGAVVAVIILLAAITGLSFWRVGQGHSVPLWIVVVFTVIGTIGFLAWAAAGGTVPVVGLLAGSLTVAVPLIFGALGGVLGERAGVVNIAIESQLLGGAFSAAVVGTLTGQPLLGLLAAMVAGVLVATILAVFTIIYVVDQVIVGVVLNVLVAGVTSFLFSVVLTPNAATMNTPPRLDRLPIPLLSDIPVIGPLLFNQNLLVYLMYLTIAVVTFALFKTRWGLRLRAVGEHPQAADTVGIRVNRTRFMTVLLAGAIAGAGGTIFTVGSQIAFGQDMTDGAGYIALAAVIFGQWHPVKATLAALLFGFATNIQNTLGVLGSPVPSEFLLMLPYVVTILVVAGAVGRSRPPAAVGTPYIKG